MEQITDNTNTTTKKKKLSKKKKVFIALIASLTGIGVTNVTASLIAYEAVFTRHNRPDYNVTPGLCCYDRIDENWEREKFKIKSGEYNLQAYYYPSTINKGLVIIAHGKNAGGDDHLAMIHAMYKDGFSVLTYDGTGNFDSDGDDTVGACQPLIDLENVIAHVQSEERFKNTPIFLIGHSMGGYAVTSVLELKSGIKACVAIAPVCNAFNLIVDTIEQYAGPLTYIAKPVFDAYQRILFKNYIKYNGVSGINSVDIPVLIAQGMCDTVITHDKTSIYAFKDKITNPNVTYYETYGMQGGHDTVLLSLDAIAYRSEIENKLKIYKNTLGKEFTDEKLAEFYATVDHAKYSELNPELVSKILETFNSAL